MPSIRRTLLRPCPNIRTVTPLVLPWFVFVGSPASAQVTAYSGQQITSPTGTLTFNWTGFVSLIAYQEAGLQVSCNSSDQGQGCTRCCLPTGFSHGGYYYGGPLQQLVTITRADGGALSALEFQAGDLYNGCNAGDGIIYLWALVSSGGNVTSFDINAPAGTYVGFSGVFDQVQLGAYSNAYARNLHQPAQPQAIAMDNMRYVASDCPAFAAPAGIVACADGTNQFVVAPVGAAPITYQWQWQALGDSVWVNVVDGVNSAPAPFAFTASGSQTAVLTRTGALTPGSVALYRCIVGNPCSTIAGAAAMLDIRGAPTITQQPQNEPLCGVPAVAQFSVQAVTTPSDPGPFTYQWQRSSQGHTWVNVIDGENTTGATTPYLVLSLDATDAAAQFRCVVANACASTTSDVASLTFGNNPVIGMQPVDQIICPGGVGAFDVTTVGTLQPSFQWRVESPPGSGLYTDVPDSATFVDPATGLSFFASGTQGPDVSISQIVLGQHPETIRFVAAITDTCGTVTSNPATLTVRAGGYANCDDSTAPPVLNVADFTCFLQKYAAGDAYANCDGSTTAPVLNVADFTCFLQSFAAGCP
jgi:hypothetical protein